MPKFLEDLETSARCYSMMHQTREWADLPTRSRATTPTHSSRRPFLPSLLYIVLEFAKLRLLQKETGSGAMPLNRTYRGRSARCA